MRPGARPSQQKWGAPPGIGSGDVRITPGTPLRAVKSRHGDSRRPTIPVRDPPSKAQASSTLRKPHEANQPRSRSVSALRRNHELHQHASESAGNASSVTIDALVKAIVYTEGQRQLPVVARSGSQARDGRGPDPPQVHRVHEEARRGERARCMAPAPGSTACGEGRRAARPAVAPPGVGPPSEGSEGPRLVLSGSERGGILRVPDCGAPPLPPLCRPFATPSPALLRLCPRFAGPSLVHASRRRALCVPDRCRSFLCPFCAPFMPGFSLPDRCHFPTVLGASSSAGLLPLFCRRGPPAPRLPLSCLIPARRPRGSAGGPVSQMRPSACRRIAVGLPLGVAPPSRPQG